MIEQKQKLEVVVFKNTHENNPEGLEQATKACYKIEKDIYDLGEGAFSLKMFEEALLGRNKVSEKNNSIENPLPYNPNDIVTLNNTLIVYKQAGKIKGYFSILSFYHKEQGKIKHVNFRFMAALPGTLQGKGIFYKKCFATVLKDLALLKKIDKTANPEVNIVQFAMLSASTPGAIYNATKFLSSVLKDIPEGKYADQYATDLAVMMGLGTFIKNRKIGISDISIKVLIEHKRPKGYTSKNPAANSFKDYNSEAGTKGTGVTYRQSLGKANTLLSKASGLKKALKVSLEKRYHKTFS